HAFLSGPGASSLGCLDTDSSHAIRCYATETLSRNDARHGYKTNISIPRSTGTPWLRSRAGLQKMASNTCAPIQVRCSVRSQRSCLPVQETTGALRAGSLRSDGLELLGARAASSLLSAAALRSASVRWRSRC